MICSGTRGCLVEAWLASTATGPTGLLSLLLVTRIQVMSVMPLAELKAKLSAVLDEVHGTHERITITRNGRPEAVLISVEDLESLEETLDILSTPGAVEQIRAAEDEIARGEAIGAEELRRVLIDRRTGAGS